MKNYGLYLLIYNLLGVFLCLTDWIRERVTINLYYFGEVTTERYNIFDFIDTPFYLFGLLVFLHYNWPGKLTKMQKTYFYTCAISLAFKWLNFDVSYTMFFVWNSFIIVGIPLMVFIEDKLNYERFRK